MAYVLGMDLGTGSLKGLLMDKKGTVVASAASAYPLLTEKPGYSEQQPEDWLKAAETVFEQLKETVADFSEKLEGISFSGQMHSLVLLDKNKQVLRPAILWNDVRTSKQCKEIMEKHGDELLSINKNIALEGFTLPKILWVMENEPDIWHEVEQILLPKDYLRFWLDGQFHTDHSDAAGTLLLDLAQKQWSEALLDHFSIAKKQLPPLVGSSAQTGVLRPELKAKYGFQQEVKIFAGGADNACAALGAGIEEAGTALLSIGTSGVLLLPEKNTENDYQGKIHFFNHVIPAMYYSMGVTLSAGNSLSWFKKVVAPEQEFETLVNEIAEVPVGAEGLLFTPYISGERTPYADSAVRGSFIGLDQRHRLAHFTRAVVEGITFSLKDVETLMKQTTDQTITRLVSVGGGAQNEQWVQIQANIFNVPILRLATEEGPGVGAAMLAAMGCQWFDSFSACRAAFVTYAKETQPIKEEVQKYQKLYEIYRKIYGATRDSCHELSDFAK